MKRTWWYKFTFLIIVATLSVVFILPTFMGFKEDGNYPIKSKINLGLDLQGGLYMILGIDFNKVYKDEVRGYAVKIDFLVNDNGVKGKIGESFINDPADPQHSYIVSNIADVEKAKITIKKYFPSQLRLTGEQGTTLTYGLTTITKTTIETQSVSKSIEVIRNRIDEFGVTEPEIISQGNDRIIVQLPGVKDIERAKALIGKTAKLTFRLVNDTVGISTINDWITKAEATGINYKHGDRFSDYLNKLNTYLKKDLPAGFELAFEKKVNKFNNQLDSKIPYLVQSIAPLTGEALQDARVQIDQQKNEPYVSLDFKTIGAKKFEKLTGDNIGRRMAIVLDGNVYSAPNIQAKIGGGRAQVTLGGGGFNKIMKEARDLALVLRAGALPVQLDFLEQRTVGPSLGQDSIEKARLASLIGGVIVFLFILFYYRISGSIAIVTLSLNITFILAALVGLEATLTLPGIAGIALTIGMAVDANIIIYERIREEIRKGVGNYKAVEGGFEHAFWTIIDANITTALAGFCLLNFGTGPIRGFAITLLIGIAATVYTSYFVSKLLFDFYMDKVEGQELSI
jgi:preprotein translocase subunit SecD